MDRLLVTHSDSHPVPIETVRDEFSGFEVRDLQVPTGGLQVDATDALVDALQGCRVLLLRPGLVTAEVVAAAAALEVIALMGSGYDHVDVEAATDAGVRVIHTPENPAPFVAEHVFALTLSLLRGLPRTFELVDQNRWDEARKPVIGLRDSTLGVVGLGTIGFQVAEIARTAFDADVLGYDPYVAGDRDSSIYPRHDRAEVEGIGVELVDDLRSLCERSDVVTLHVPHTDETDGLVGDDELAALGDGHLVNTARGAVVDQAALVDAVRGGRFTGEAALDVLEEEPPEDGAPVLDCPNVFVTPHIAGVTTRSVAQEIHRTAEKVRAALRGDAPGTTVNPAVDEADSG